jgi:hypothetical protein
MSNITHASVDHFARTPSNAMRESILDKHQTPREEGIMQPNTEQRICFMVTVTVVPSTARNMDPPSL